MVPILYLLALSGAAMLATGRADAHVTAPPRGTAAAHRAHAGRATPARHRGFHVRRRIIALRQHYPRRSGAVAASAPIVVAVSRSEDVRAPIAVAPAALVLRIAAVTTPATMQQAIDRCIGPVAIDWSSDPSAWGVHPSEIAEHDYCGGSVFTSLATGSQVQVVGGGLSGRYVVNGLRRFVPAGASASELDGMGDVALQTCVSNGMVLVGLDRIS